MKNMQDNSMRVPARRACVLGLALAITLTGCGLTGTSASADSNERSQAAEVVTTEAQETQTDQATAVTTANVTSTGVIDATDLFSDRDLQQVADTDGATAITLASGQDVQITEEGVYVIGGQATDATIVVDVDSSAKVQLVLDGVTMSNADFPCIYVKSADKVFVTTTEGSNNTLEVTGSFVADGETNTDAAIFSRDYLVLNGLGTLVVSSTDNGITCKDDLKVTGGSYQVTTTGDALEANESILVAGGSLSIASQKDGLHAENDEDDTVGYVYICGGAFDIQAADDGIHATTYLQVDEGTFSIDAAEALEATYVQVNGGTLDIKASDDGINATYKSSSIGTPTIEIAGGQLAIEMGSGDTDALDSNGNLVVSGGTIDITAQFAFDFDGQASFTGGTITVNGEQVSEIANSMMGGGMGGPMGGMGRGEQDGGMPMGGHGGPGQGMDDGATMSAEGDTVGA